MKGENKSLLGHAWDFASVIQTYGILTVSTSSGKMGMNCLCPALLCPITSNSFIVTCQCAFLSGCFLLAGAPRADVHQPEGIKIDVVFSLM